MDLHVSNCIRGLILVCAAFASPAWTLAEDSSADQPDESGFYPNKPGEWLYHPSRDAVDRLRLPAAAAQALAAKLDGIMAVLGESPVFHPPLGFQGRAEARYQGRGCAGDPYTCNTGPAIPGIWVSFYDFMVDRRGQPAWGGEARAVIELVVNDPSTVDESCFAEGGPLLPDGRRICGPPVEVERLAGLTFYAARGSWGDDNDRPQVRAVIGRPGLPIWVPVSRQEYLEALLRVREEELAKSRSLPAPPGDPHAVWLAEKSERQQGIQEGYEALKETDPAQAEEFLRKSKQAEAEVEARLRAETPVASSDATPHLESSIAAIREELSRLSPMERVSQAVFKRPEEQDVLGSGLVPDHTPHALPLVSLNPALIDGSQPPEMIQVISVSSQYRGSNITNEAAYRFLRTVDWNRVASFLR
jgi:hypothetical protein